MAHNLTNLTDSERHYVTVRDHIAAGRTLMPEDYERFERHKREVGASRMAALDAQFPVETPAVDET